MKTIPRALLISACLVQASEADLVPNGEFKMFKPGTNYTVTATFAPGNSFARGVGDGIQLAGGAVTYSDGSPDGLTGDGIPDIDMPGWAPLQSGNDLFGNGVDGSNGMNLFAAWGGDGRIQSAESLGTIESGSTYTISVLVGGPDSGPIQGPLAFHLAADGVQLTPSSFVDPTLPNGGAFQEISRTYDADSIAGHIGAEMTIVLGVEDANDFANRVVFDNVCMVRSGPPPNLRLSITPDGPNLDFNWDSKPGVFYVLRSSTDLAAELSTWESVDVPGSVENNGVFEIATNPPLNMHPIPRPVADPTRFYRVEEFALPPVTILDENFDTAAAGTLPADWTTGFDPADTAMNTSWALGDPAGGPASGPSAALSGANCVGTNLTANYGVSSIAWLRTPTIDLTTATGATLTFQHWVDIDEFDNLDRGTVRVLDAGSLTELGVVETNINGINLDFENWDGFSAQLPAAALGQPIVLEFGFVSDADGTFDASGWYLDDVVVTTPAP